MPVASWWMATRPGTPRALEELAAHEVAGALRRDERRRRRRAAARPRRSGSRTRGRTAACCPAAIAVARRRTPRPRGAARRARASSRCRPRCAASAGSTTRSPCSLGLGDAARARPQADDHVDAGVLQVQRVGVALGAVADDRDGLAVEQGEVRVVVVEHARSVSGDRRLPARPARLRRRTAAERQHALDVLLRVAVQAVLAAPTAGPGSSRPRPSPRRRRWRPAASAAAARRRARCRPPTPAPAARRRQRALDPLPGPRQDLHDPAGVGAGDEVVVEAALLPGDRVRQRAGHAVGRRRSSAICEALSRSGVGYGGSVGVALGDRADRLGRSVPPTIVDTGRAVEPDHVERRARRAGRRSRSSPLAAASDRGRRARRARRSRSACRPGRPGSAADDCPSSAVLTAHVDDPDEVPDSRSAVPAGRMPLGSSRWRRPARRASCRRGPRSRSACRRRTTQVGAPMRRRAAGRSSGVVDSCADAAGARARGRQRRRRTSSYCGGIWMVEPATSWRRAAAVGGRELRDRQSVGGGDRAQRLAPGDDVCAK